MKALPSFCKGCVIVFLMIALPRVVAAQAMTTTADAAAIQAIEQAPDPSAAVAAYANGLSLDRTDPKMHEAYVNRMVDLGLPELAYHQAQTLTTMQSNDGVAWGVVAYVEARRGQMPEALSAVILAGQLAADNKFVEHTVGELLAWYDLKADKSSIPDNTKDGLAKIRGRVEKQAAFIEAYSRAQQAYQSQAKPESQPTQSAPAQSSPIQVWPSQVAPPQIPDSPQVAPAPTVPAAPQASLSEDQIAPLGYGAPVALPSYSENYGDLWDATPDYYYASGPGWVAPTPWWWWQPYGFWGGCNFFPFGSACLFGDFDDFNRFHHDGDFSWGDRFGHGDHFGHGGFAHGEDPAAWHHTSQGRGNFFGAPARPTASVARWAHQSSQSRPSLQSTSTGSGWWSAASGRNPATSPGSTFRSVPANAFEARAGASRPSFSGARQGNVVTGRGNWAPPMTSQSQIASRAPAASTLPGNAWSSSFYHSPQVNASAWAGRGYTSRGYMSPHATAPSAGAFGAYRGVPSYRNPVYSTPRWTAPRAGSFGGYRQAPNSWGGWGGGRAMNSVPRYSSGASFSRGFNAASSVRSFGGYRGGSIGNGFRGGSSSGGFHGGGGSFGGGSHGGGFGGGGHGGGRR